MSNEERTFLRFTLLGTLLSIASCFFPYDRCACGGYARGLPLMILDPHNSLIFLVIALSIDIAVWSTAAYAVYRVFTMIRRLAVRQARS